MKKYAYKKIIYVMLLVPVCLLMLYTAVYAEEPNEETDMFDIDTYDFTDIEKTSGNISFKEIVGAFVSGDTEMIILRLKDALEQSINSGIKSRGSTARKVLVLGIFGAVFANFSTIFSESRISETGFFITYMLMFAYLAAGFYTSMNIAESVIKQILEFMRALMPAYFMAAAWTGAGATSVAMYESMLMAVYLVSHIFLELILPFIRIYIMLVLAANIVKEDVLSKLTDLFREIIQWSVKTLAGIVFGIHMIQSLILPYVDSLKQSSLIKLVEAVPGIGNGAGAAVNMMLGSGVLIKNAIGTAGAVVLFLISVFPVIKLVILMLMFRSVAVVLQPVCDKRMVDCISYIAEGHKMLLMVVMASTALFILSIAITCSATNIGYLTAG